MTLRAKMIQIFVIAGMVFFVGAWSVSSLNAQMRKVYQVNFEAQSRIMDLSAIREVVNQSMALRQPISEGTRGALVQAPTAFDCCAEEKALVVESVDAVRADGRITPQKAYRLTEAWSRLFTLQIDRLQTEQANWQGYVNLRNWLVPTLAMFLLALSLGIAWFRLNVVLLQPFDAVMRQLTQLMRGGNAFKLELQAAPEELRFLSDSVERLVLSNREAIKIHSDQSAVVSKHSDALELQFQKLVEIASQPAFVLDTSGEVRMWNKHMMELTGIARARASKVKFIDEFMSGESRAIFEEAFLMARGETIPDAFRCELHVGNRLIRNVTMQLSPQVDSALGVNRILGVLEAGSADEIRSNSASAAKSTKSERLYAELSNSLHFLGPVNENLTEIESSRRLKSLISALSWIETRAFERSLQPIDLTELVEHYVSSIMMQLDESSIALALETNGDKAVAMGDASALIFVLQALAQNATEAMEAADNQGNKLAVKVWHEGNDVLVRLRDTGSGLTLDESFTPFAPFATTKSEQGHAGLGLTHARDLIEEMSGSLTIEPSSSLVDFGFGVVIRLPKADDVGNR